MPHQQFAYIPGKNASDIALVIDAMDLLHTGRFEGFCLVSSDSDFTRLASRIREQGVDVFGFGEQKTAESFRQACRRFIYTENLLPQAFVANEAGATDPSAATDPEQAPPAKPLQSPSAAVPLLRRVIAQMDDDEGWVESRRAGQQLANLAPDFDRVLRPRQAEHLVRKSGAFEVERPVGRPGAHPPEARPQAGWR